MGRQRDEEEGISLVGRGQRSDEPPVSAGFGTGSLSAEQWYKKQQAEEAAGGDGASAQPGELARTAGAPRTNVAHSAAARHRRATAHAVRPEQQQQCNHGDTQASGREQSLQLPGDSARSITRLTQHGACAPTSQNSPCRVRGAGV